MKKLLAFPLILLLLALSACAPADGTLRDGQYTVKVTLSGGSGRASVASPAEMTVADGQATAVIVWSSPYYKYMRSDGVTYCPVNTDGNSTFELPISLDESMAVSAQTIAMSEPHEIDYTLRFDSATLKPLADDGSSLIPLGAGAVAVVILLIVLAGVFLHKKRQRENRI